MVEVLQNECLQTEQIESHCVEPEKVDIMVFMYQLTTRDDAKCLSKSSSKTWPIAYSEIHVNSPWTGIRKIFYVGFVLKCLPLEICNG